MSSDNTLSERRDPLPHEIIATVMRDPQGVRDYVAALERLVQLIKEDLNLLRMHLRFIGGNTWSTEHFRYDGHTIHLINFPFDDMRMRIERILSPPATVEVEEIVEGPEVMQADVIQERAGALVSRGHYQTSVATETEPLAAPEPEKKKWYDYARKGTAMSNVAYRNSISACIEILRREIRSVAESEASTVQEEETVDDNDDYIASPSSFESRINDTYGTYETDNTGCSFPSREFPPRQSSLATGEFTGPLDAASMRFFNSDNQSFSEHPSPEPSIHESPQPRQRRALSLFKKMRRGVSKEDSPKRNEKDGVFRALKAKSSAFFRRMIPGSQPQFDLA